MLGLLHFLFFYFVDILFFLSFFILKLILMNVLRLVLFFPILSRKTSILNLGFCLIIHLFSSTLVIIRGFALTIILTYFSDA